MPAVATLLLLLLLLLLLPPPQSVKQMDDDITEMGKRVDEAAQNGDLNKLLFEAASKA